MRLPLLEADFPKLAAAGYEKTSEETGFPPEPGAYNCIAWAAGDTRWWWWPDPNSYWPPWTKLRDETVGCFVRTFRWLGYRPCQSSRRQFGFEKVALYAIHRSAMPKTLPSDWSGTNDWIPTHMARQLPNGAWTSKCGPGEDITHFTLDALERYGYFGFHLGIYPIYAYGCPAVVLRRPIFIGWFVRILQRALWKYEGMS